MTAITSQTARDEFLQLLTTQLRHQDPLEPVPQQEMLSQLAQFSTLEGIEALNANFEDMLQLQQLTQGSSLLGRTAVFRSEDGALPQQGLVESARVEDNRLLLQVGGNSVPIDQVIELLA